MNGGDTVEMTYVSAWESGMEDDAGRAAAVFALK